MQMTAADVKPHIDRDRLTERLQRMVATPSENPPGNEAAVAELVSSYCSELDLDVSLYECEPARPSIVARWSSGGDRTVGYCSHIDVVPAGDPGLWNGEPFAASIEGDVMHGRGACDAKGPIAAALEAVTALKSAGARFDGTLELELVSDEETMGFKGAGYLVEERIIGPDVAIVGEPTSLRVVHAQRGACWIRITTRGVAAHGSAPERGVSAIRHTAEITQRLEETLPDITHPVLGGPSINVGTISGGAKVNIVPAGCVIEVDRRSLPSESSDDVLASIHAAVDRARDRFPELDATVDLLFYAPPFEIAPEAELVRSCSEAVSEATGTPAGLVGFRGASDARFLAESGADVVLLGPGDIALAHTARELVDLREVEAAALAYALAFARLLDMTPK